MKAFCRSLVLGLIFLASAGPVIALDPIDQAQLFLEKGLDQRAIETLLPLLESKDEERLSQVVEILYSLYSLKSDTARSIEVLETFIHRFPDSTMTPLYLYWVAKLEENRGQHERAQNIYRDLIGNRLTKSKDPYNLLSSVYEDLAYSLEKNQKDFPGAIQVLEHLLQAPIHQEERNRIMNQVGMLYEKIGNVDRAKNIYREVVAILPDCPARNFAALRLIYLESEPTWARQDLQTLANELQAAFSGKDLAVLGSLAKAGDFWFGLMYSEFEVGEFALIESYLAEYLPYTTPVFRELEKKENGYHLKIENWPDPEYDIMYLSIEEGRNGWEWTGVILSSHELESLF
ncbi:MAG TPA: hypothetical protein VLH40_07180 [Atribacteraceae bacterium]|nr:hypothetical protein [Atribacteraceae bacterium]